MRTSWQTAKRAAGCGIILALLAVVPRTAAAQANPFERYDAPGLVQNLDGSTVRTLEQEFRTDLYALNAFGGRKSVDRYQRATLERPQPWRLYGRVGPMHFQNGFDSSQGMQMTFRRTGPTLTGRTYIGIHRTFD